VETVVRIVELFGLTEMVNYFRTPGAFYGYSLPETMPLKDAKVWVRNWLKVNRLPNGTEFWLS
jgi:hypothetical protein